MSHKADPPPDLTADEVARVERMEQVADDLDGATDELRALVKEIRGTNGNGEEAPGGG